MVVSTNQTKHCEGDIPYLGRILSAGIIPQEVGFHMMTTITSPMMDATNNANKEAIRGQLGVRFRT